MYKGKADIKSENVLAECVKFVAAVAVVVALFFGW